MAHCCVLSIYLDLFTFRKCMHVHLISKVLYILSNVKNILIRRRESDTYLAIVSRHGWSSWITMKQD